MGLLTTTAGAPPPASGVHRFTRHALTAVALALVAAALGALVWQAGTVFLVLFAAVLVAVLLRALADPLAAHTPLPPRWALAAVVAGLVGLVALAGWVRGPAIASEAAALTDTLPQTFEQLRARVANTGWGHALLERLPPLDQVAGRLVGGGRGGGDVLARIAGVASTLVTMGATVLIVCVTGIYLAAQPELYVRGVVRLVPPARRDAVDAALDAAGHTLGRWLMARVAAMAFVGVLTGLGLWWFGLPFVFTLALLAALLDFVPNFGPIMAAVPAVLLALVQGPRQALHVALFYWGVQLLEAYVLTPVLQQRAARLAPGLLVAAQLVLGALAGVLGLALAAPLAAVALVLVRRLYVEGALEGHGEAASP